MTRQLGKHAYSLASFASNQAYWSVGLRGYFVASTFFATVLAARLLGGAMFGSYTFVMTIALFIAGLAQAGAVPLAIRETARTKSVHYVKQFFPFTLGVLVTMVAVLFAGLSVFRVSGALAGTGLFLCVAISLCSAIGTLMAGVVRGSGSTIKGQLPDLVIRPSIFVALLGVVWMLDRSIDVEAALILNLVAVGGTLLTSAILLVNSLQAMKGGTREDIRLLAWVRDLFRIAVVGWIGAASLHAVILIAGLVGELTVVGEFRVAAQFSLIIPIGLVAVESVQSPRFAAAYAAQSLDDIRSLLRESRFIALLVAVPLSALLVLFAAPLLSLLFPPEFENASSAVRVLAIGQVVNCYFGSVGTLLISCGREADVIRASALALLVLACFSIALIPAYGSLGGAVAASISLTIRNLLCARSSRGFVSNLEASMPVRSRP